jgi:ATP-dependent RNA helicase DDX18/HAS1
MLLPQELQFLKYLRQANVKLTEYEFPPHKIANMQVLMPLLGPYYAIQASGKALLRLC